MRVGPLLLVFLLAAAGAAAEPADAPPPGVRAEATDGPLAVVLTGDVARPALGAPVHLHIAATLAAEPTARIEWPDMRALVRAGVGGDVVDVESSRVTADGRALDAVLRLYDEGRHDLPAITIAAFRGAESVDPLATVTLQGVGFDVAVDVPDDAEPAPPRGALALTVPPAPFPWKWVLLAAGVLAVAVLVVVLIRRRPRVVPPPPPPPPAHERALAALRALAARGLPGRGAIEPYFVALSEILRRYLEDRFGLRAPEQTTEEFLADVSQSAAGRRAIESAHRNVLREFLTQADLVKFARARPASAECAAAGTVAERFVTETAAPADAPAAPVADVAREAAT